MRNQRKRNPLVGLVILLVIVGALIFFGFKSYIDSFSEPVDADASVKSFVVSKGESGESVAQRLVSEGFIRSSLAFKAALKARDNPAIQVGDFKISGAMSLNEIIDNLTKGPTDRRVTLLEGWRVEEVAAKLNKDLGINQADFLKVAKEGYMFPDTYLFNPEVSAQSVAQTLENTFNSRYDSALQAKIRAQGLTPEQGVIMASLVEREARSDEVRTKVASIILKRFKMGMKLDIDATVRYAKDTATLKQGKLVNKYWEAITRDDYTEVVSPYNTYLNNGLPPGPICNPSLSSLKAVANADPSTPYLYYYHDSKGNSYYGKTLDEHNANVANH